MVFASNMSLRNRLLLDKKLDFAELEDGLGIQSVWVEEYHIPN